MKVLFSLVLSFLVITTANSNLPLCTCLNFTSTICGVMSGGVNFLGEIVAKESMGEYSRSYFYHIKVLDAIDEELIGDTIVIDNLTGASCANLIGGHEVGTKHFFSTRKNVSGYNLEEQRHEFTYQLGGCGLYNLRFERDSLFGHIMPEVFQMSYSDFKEQYENCLSTPTYMYAAIGFKFWKDSIPVGVLNVKINDFDTQLHSDGFTPFPYAATDRPNGTTQPIIITSNSEPTRGVTTADLLQVRKHLLGIESFTNPYQLLAADVNLSGSISTLDLILMQRMILGQIEEFPAQHSWLFVRPGYDFSAENINWIANETNATKIYLDELFVSRSQFTAIKLGDVNGSL